jgi:hypothetical protein
MGFLEAFGHVFNLLFMPLALGAMAAGMAKAVWRQRLQAQAWWHLAVACGAVCSLVTLAGLALTGQDGRMATYAAMVLACAATLWWQGFRR